MSVSRVLLASYLYYIKDHSMMEDHEFDMMCRKLHARWDTIEHPHKHLLDKEGLKAGTAYHLNELDYPQIIRLTGDMVIHYHNQGRDYLFWLENQFGGGE